MAEEVGPTSAPAEPEILSDGIRIEIVEQEGDWFWRAYDVDDNMVNNSDAIKNKTMATKAAKAAYPDALIA